MDHADPRSLARLLLYGHPATRRALAAEFLASAHPEDWAMLAETIRSREPWLLRARSLELLGTIAAEADEPTAKLILATLLDSPEE